MRELDPLNFTPPKSWQEKLASAVGNAVIKGAKWVKSRMDAIIADYKTRGLTYKIVQGGIAAFKIVGSLAEIVAGAKVIIGTGGFGIPFGAAAILSGVNEIINSCHDIYLVNNDRFDEVGETDYGLNLLKSTGGMIGGTFGNVEAGEYIGNVIYQVIEIMGIGTSFYEIKDLIKNHGKDVIDFGRAAADFKEVFIKDPNAVKNLLRFDKYLEDHYQQASLLYEAVNAVKDMDLKEIYAC